jgi:hypothetical protein
MVRRDLSSETHSRTPVGWERISGDHQAVDEAIHHPKTATLEEMEMEMEAATPEEMAQRPVHSGPVRTSRCQTGLSRTRRRLKASQTKLGVSAGRTRCAYRV